MKQFLLFDTGVSNNIFLFLFLCLLFIVSQCFFLFDAEPFGKTKCLGNPHYVYKKFVGTPTQEDDLNNSYSSKDHSLKFESFFYFISILLFFLFVYSFTYSTILFFYSSSFSTVLSFRFILLRILLFLLFFLSFACRPKNIYIFYRASLVFTSDLCES